MLWPNLMILWSTLSGFAPSKSLRHGTPASEALTLFSVQFRAVFFLKPRSLRMATSPKMHGDMIFILNLFKRAAARQTRLSSKHPDDTKQAFTGMVGISRLREMTSRSDVRLQKWMVVRQSPPKHDPIAPPVRATRPRPPGVLVPPPRNLPTALHGNTARGEKTAEMSFERDFSAVFSPLAVWPVWNQARDTIPWAGTLDQPLAHPAGLH